MSIYVYVSKYVCRETFMIMFLCVMHACMCVNICIRHTGINIYAWMGVANMYYA